MDIKTIINLHEAGFKAEDIEKMINAITEPAKAPETATEAPKDPAPINISTDAEKAPEQPAKAPEGGEKADNKADEVIAQLNSRIEALTAAMEKITSAPLFPSMDEVKPLGIEDVLSNYFKDK